MTEQQIRKRVLRIVRRCYRPQVKPGPLAWLRRRRKTAWVAEPLQDLVVGEVAAIPAQHADLSKTHRERMLAAMNEDGHNDEEQAKILRALPAFIFQTTRPTLTAYQRSILDQVPILTADAVDEITNLIYDEAARRIPTS